MLVRDHLRLRERRRHALWHTTMVRFVLGEKWLVAEPLVGWLALSAGLLGLSSGAYTTFDALGKPHLGARMLWVRLIFLAAAIIPVAMIADHPRDVAATRMGRDGCVHAYAVIRGWARGRRFLARLSPCAVAPVRGGGGHGDRDLSPEHSFAAKRFPPGCGYPARCVFVRHRAARPLVAERFSDSPEKDVVTLVVRHVQRRRAGAIGPIHIISKFRHRCRRNRTARTALAEILGRHAEVKLWATHAPDPAIDSRAAVTTIDAWRLQFPISGTFIFVGVFLHIGSWIRLARPIVRSSSSTPTASKNFAA